MNTFKRFHPVTIVVYFFVVTGFTMFYNQPVFLVISCIGALIFSILLLGRELIASIPFYFLFFLGAAVINPLFNHNGTTILFFLNGQVITKEAVIYGFFMAIMLIAVLMWFRALSILMSSDKWLFLFGTVTPRLALVMSMALRYIPLFRMQVQKIQQTQKAMGAINEDSYLSKGAGSLQIFSVMVTWSLENAIDTADSMRARGFVDHHKKNYKRSRFVNYKFRRSDGLLIFLVILLTGILSAGILKGAISYSYYPTASKLLFSKESIIPYAAYGILVLLPAILEIKERIQWIYYKSGM